MMIAEVNSLVASVERSVFSNKSSVKMIGRNCHIDFTLDLLELFVSSSGLCGEEGEEFNVDFLCSQNRDSAKGTDE